MFKSNKFNKHKFFISIGLAFVILNVIICLYLWISSKVHGNVVEKNIYAKAPTKVYVWQVHDSDFIQNFVSIGSTRAVQDVNVVSEVSGTVKQILISSGQDVVSGQLLVLLDNSTLDSDLAKAKAKLTLAKNNFIRYEKLFNAKLYAQADLDKIRSEMDSASADVQSIVTNLKKHAIKAPFNGTLGIVDINIGQYVPENTKIASLVNKSKLYIDFNIPEQYTQNIKLPMDIKLSTNKMPDKQFVGKIIALDAKIDDVSHTLRALAIVDNEDLQLIPGIFLDIKVPLNTASLKILIPQTAVVYNPKGTFVYCIKNNHAYLKPITIDNIDDDKVLVKKGLQIGDLIVSNGQINLYDGIAVDFEKKIG